MTITGNLTDDGTRTYAWDAQQRLVRIGYTGTGRSTEFRYDAFGRRTAVVERDGTTATETRYLWCGERVCQARDGADTVTRRHYDEGELAVSASGDVAAFYAEDHLGAIRDLRMGDGQVQASYDYDPYGAPSRTDETGGVHADYRYAGLVQHAPSGLYLAHYRAYSADDGRWMSRDPIGEAGGINLYAYANSAPTIFTDPLGFAPTGPDGGPNFFDCLANCIRTYDPLGDPGKVSLTAAGGTFPKSAVGLPRGLGGASSMTTVPSAVAHGLGGGASGTLGGIARGVGRFFSPIWITYGVYLFGLEAYCADACANNRCAY